MKHSDITAGQMYKVVSRTLLCNGEYVIVLNSDINYFMVITQKTARIVTVYASELIEAI